MALLDRLPFRRSAPAGRAVEMQAADILLPAPDYGTGPGIEARSTAPLDPAPAGRVLFAGGRIYGAFMSPFEALRLSAVWACVSVIAKSIASCDWTVFSEARNGDRQYQRFNRLFWLLNVSPNPEARAFAVREAMLTQALIHGAAFAEIERDEAGRPAALWPLLTEQCTLDRDRASGRLFLRHRGDSGGETILDYDDVYHLHGPGLDGLNGMDVVNVAARGLAHARAAEVYGGAFYGNGTSPGGILSAPGPLIESQIEDLRSQIDNRHQGPDKAFKFMVLQGGMTFTPMAIDNDAAQFIETRHLLIEEVCRWFGVPPHKIAHLLRATFSNIEHQSLEFTRDCLTPWCRRLEQEANWKLALANSIWTEIDLEPLTWGDAKSRAETDAINVRSGIRTRNEVRRRQNLNSLGGDGDLITVEQNITTLERVAAGLPAIDPPAPAAPAEPIPAEPTPGARALERLMAEVAA